MGANYDMAVLNTLERQYEKPITMETKPEAIYRETERCKKLIREHISKSCDKAIMASTIEESNEIFMYEFEHIKSKAFDSIHSSVKPYIVYNINKHFKYLSE